VCGIEKRRGRVSGVVTEPGRIDCDAVVLASGAWSLLFCGASADLAAAEGTVLRDAHGLDRGLPETATWSNFFAFRKRMDGGYTIANGHGNVVL
jgi:glycine/D-amino acid oxidase-like deaminating enzyme